MSPYLALATSLVLLGIAIWIWEAGHDYDEPARLLLVWLVFSAATAMFAAAGMWIGDATVSLSFTAVARILFLVVTFLLFLFARSFSARADYTVLFWSVPLQFGMAVIMVNWQSMFESNADIWVMRTWNPAAMCVMAVGWFYGILSLVYAVILYLTLRREGRDKEKSRTLMMIAAMAVLFVAGAARNVPSAATSYATSAVYLGYLLGLLMLLWALRGPIVFKSTRR
ncbi:MAG: hypothetical protein AB1384_00800 [Actinomycetota bacterium]